MSDLVIDPSNGLLIPARPEEDDDIDIDDLPLAQAMAFKGKGVMLQTPHDFAVERLREYLVSKGHDEDPDTLIWATLLIKFDERQGGRADEIVGARLSAAMTLTQALLSNQQSTVDRSHWWAPYSDRVLKWREAGYPVIALDPNIGVSAFAYAYDAIFRSSVPQAYTPAAQVDLDPEAFTRFVWQAQLQSRYQKYIEAFWAKHEDGFNMLIKGSLLRAALYQRDEGTLDARHVHMVLRSVGLPRDVDWDKTSFRTFADAPLSDNYLINELKVYRYTSTDIMVIDCVSQDDVVLYIPGNSSPLHGFSSIEALQRWFADQCRDVRKRAALASHFSAADRADGGLHCGVDTVLESFAIYPLTLINIGRWAPREHIYLGDPLSPYPFSHFKDSIKARSLADGKQQINTQADYYRKQLAEGVDTAATVVGAACMVVPELLPVLLALGAGQVVMGGGDMIMARDRKGFKEGAGRVVYGLLNALPLVPEVVSQFQAGRAALAAEGEALASEVAQARAQVEELDGEPVSDTAAHVEARTKLQEADNAMSHHQAKLDRAAAADKAYSEDIELEDRNPSATDLAQVRPVLDNLSPGELTQLQRFKIRHGLPDYGDARGVLHADGIDYVRMRAEAYQVKWLVDEQQYRICMDDTPKWGPFLRADDSGFWDLDLRESVHDAQAVSPTVPPAQGGGAELDGIRQQPLDPMVNVKLPMEGVIKVQGESLDFYVEFKRDPIAPEDEPDVKTRVRVYYDVDAGCWRAQGGGYHVWREPSKLWGSRWVHGSARDFGLARSKASVASKFEVVSLPGVPQLSEATSEIPQEVHMIWLGDQPIGDRYSAGLLSARSSGRNIVLHVNCTHESLATEQARQAWQSAHPGITVKHLPDEPFYAEFANGLDSDAFVLFSTPGSTHQTYAAAADLLRYRIIYEYGGTYKDLDDVLGSWVGAKLNAGPNDILLGDAFPMFWTQGGGNKYGNSVFGSHAGNPLLKKVLDTANERFAALPEAFFETPRPRDGAPQALKQAYIQTISSVTGPDMLNDVVSKYRPDYYSAGLAPMPDWVRMRRYEDRIGDLFPYRRHTGKAPVTVGSAHSWEFN